MPVLYLTESDVRHVLTMDLALEAVETGLKKVSLDEAVNVPRTRCQTDHSMLHVLSAAGKTLGFLGFKAYVTNRKGAQFQVHLFDGKSGEHVAWMQADYLGQARTGAASGIATKFLSRVGSCTLGIIGSGKQARTQVEAICKVRPISNVSVFSPNEDRRNQFAREMSEHCQVPVTPVDCAEKAVRGHDVVVTATSAREPVLRGEWLDDGVHLNAIGSNFLGKAEIDLAAVRRASRVVVDSKDQIRYEGGDLLPAIEEGHLHWAEVQELGHIVAGRFPGREQADEVTLFKSLGIAIEDIAVAGKVYAAAKLQGVGRMLDF